MKKPFITVVIPVYNVAPFIEQTMSSILEQSFTSFECLLIDDKSTDETVEIILSYKDPRITLIRKEKNSGYTDSLNHGISIAKGKYIARMDGDDVMDKYRFEKQINFLERNPTIGVCGSNYDTFPMVKYNQLQEYPKDIFTFMLFSCEIAHPSVLFRKELFADGTRYNTNKEPAEDYDLWSRLLFKTKFYNIQEPLLHYRVHSMQVSSSRRQVQQEKSLEARYFIWQNLLKQNLFSYSSFKTIFGNNYSGTLEELFSQLQSLDAIGKEVFMHPDLNEILLQRKISELKTFKIRGYFFKNPSLSVSQIPRLVIHFRKYFSFFEILKIFYRSL